MGFRSSYDLFILHSLSKPSRIVPCCILLSSAVDDRLGGSSGNYHVRKHDHSLVRVVQYSFCAGRGGIRSRIIGSGKQHWKSRNNNSEHPRAGRFLEIRIRRVPLCNSDTGPVGAVFLDDSQDCGSEVSEVQGGKETSESIRVGRRSVHIKFSKFKIVGRTAAA